jgi:hypothetical protein
VVPPVGPYTGSPTGARISRIDAAGVRTTVVDGLPSSQTSPAVGSSVSGVADLAFVRGTLYALISGAGCSHGVAGIPNEVVRVNGDGTTTQVADLSAFLAAHPVANPEPADFEPDGTPYSMLALRGRLYVVQPNQGAIERVSVRSGAIERLVDVSASQGHVVPTAIAFRAGRFYLGNLGTFPIVTGSQHVYTISRDGTVVGHLDGFSAILGLTFDRRGRLYVLETATVGPAPGTGDVVRVDRSGERETIASGLSFPTGITVGPDDALYVSDHGFGFAPGDGQILRIPVDDE